MTLAKEKLKLSQILDSIETIDVFNEKNFDTLNEAYVEYSKTIRVLYTKHGNVFANLLKFDVPEIKKNKQIVVESDDDQLKHEHFMLFKRSIMQATDSTLEYIDNFIL